MNNRKVAVPNMQVAVVTRVERDGQVEVEECRLLSVGMSAPDESNDEHCAIEHCGDEGCGFFVAVLSSDQVGRDGKKFNIDGIDFARYVEQGFMHVGAKPSPGQMVAMPIEGHVRMVGSGVGARRELVVTHKWIDTPASKALRKALHVGQRVPQDGDVVLDSVSWACELKDIAGQHATLSFLKPGGFFARASDVLESMGRHADEHHKALLEPLGNSMCAFHRSDSEWPGWWKLVWSEGSR